MESDILYAKIICRLFATHPLNYCYCFFANLALALFKYGPNSFAWMLNMAETISLFFGEKKLGLKNSMTDRRWDFARRHMCEYKRPYEFQNIKSAYLIDQLIEIGSNTVLAKPVSSCSVRWERTLRQKRAEWLFRISFALMLWLWFIQWWVVFSQNLLFARISWFMTTNTAFIYISVATEWDVVFLLFK